METCLFCDSDRETSEWMFICSKCGPLLDAQDDEKLQSAYALASQKGKWRKAMAIKMVMDDRNKL